MNVLVVNIGSTSLKFRLVNPRTQRTSARGAIEGIGGEARVRCWIGDEAVADAVQPVPDQQSAVEVCIRLLDENAAQRGGLQIDAVGFKAVHGGPIDRPVRVDERVLGIMEQYAAACPAHNPAYVAAMRAFARRRPDLPLVAAFETGFHQTIPAARQVYAIPHAWTEELGVRRYGFHGASHAYVAQEIGRRLGRDDLRIISCHLGGSSSVCAIQSGKSVANSFGYAPQSGLPHNNRAGDFDAFALPVIAEQLGTNIDEVLRIMSREGGLLGISGVSNDMREILSSAHAGNPRAVLARDVLIESVRHYLGAYLVALKGLDVLVFTGGIGWRSSEIRSRVCAGLEFLGIRLDPERNEAPPTDGGIATDEAPIRINAIETNEEIIVAQQTFEVLSRD